MEFKLFNKVFRVGVTKKFSDNDLLGQNICYGGIFMSDGENHFVLVQWFEDANKTINNPVLNTVVPLV